MKTKISPCFVLLGMTAATLFAQVPNPLFEEQQPPEQVLIDDTDGNVPKTPVRESRKWIGVLLAPVGETLRSHLNLPERVGIVVEEVVPESPASLIGLRKHDILLAANGLPLNATRVLIEQVSKSAEGGAIELEWLRKGDRMTAKLIPTDRPSAVEWREVERAPMGEGRGGEGRGGEGRALPPRGEPGPQWRSLDQLGKLRGLPQRFRIIGPGFESRLGNVPNDLRIEIKKDGNKPAKISVQQENNSWNVTEDHLDELPENIRPYIERMLGSGALAGEESLQMFGFEWADEPLGDEPDVAPWPRFEERIEEMERRMQRMLNEMQRMRDEPTRGLPVEQDDEQLDNNEDASYRPIPEAISSTGWLMT